MIKYIKEQIKVIKEKDPAINSTLEVFLYPSFKALIYYKISHYFYLKNHHFRVNSKIKVTNYYDYGVIIKLHFSIPLFS